MNAPGWEIRPLQSPPLITSGHYINRYHKFFAHQLFPDADWSIYLDGNVRALNCLAQIIDVMRERAGDIGAFKHPHAHNLRQEAEVCALSKFDAWDFSRVDEQLATYAKDGLDLDAIIPACYILARDHSSTGLPKAMSLWWSQIFEFTKRDQMSFSWVIAQSSLKLVLLDYESSIDPSPIYRSGHARKPVLARVYRRIRKELSRSC